MSTAEEKRKMHNDRVARWKERNPERAREVANAASKRFREKNLEKVNAKEKEYRERNKEARKTSWARWYEGNKEKVRARDRERRSGSTEAKVKYLLQSAKSRSKKRGVEFHIAVEDIDIPTHCPLLNVKLIYGGNKIHSENSASIDRIDSNIGYVKGNVWIVSRRANVIKNDATYQELRMISERLEEKIKAIWDRNGLYPGLRHSQHIHLALHDVEVIAFLDVPDAEERRWRALT